MSLESDAQNLATIREGLTSVNEAAHRLLDDHLGDGSLQVLGMISSIESETRWVSRYLGIVLDG